MAGRVNQIEIILLAVLGLVRQTDGLAFYGDAALPLNIHVVQELILEFAGRDQAAELDETVGERGFAVVYMGDDAEVADVFHIFLYLVRKRVTLGC